MIDFSNSLIDVVLIHLSLFFCLSNLLSYIFLELQDFFLFNELFGLNAHFIRPYIHVNVLSVDSIAIMGQLYTFLKEKQILPFAI